MKGKGFVNFMAYIAIAFIAVALILGKILSAVGLSSTVIGALNLVAQIIAYAITAVFAFYYAKSRKHIAWMICYIIFVIAIIVFLVLGIV
ncbi:MAG: hypothetical protein IJW36_00235 [Clostridia bacterium]|nr:hypothetical protein [Clostridia bacterium]